MGVGLGIGDARWVGVGGGTTWVGQRAERYPAL